MITLNMHDFKILALRPLTNCSAGIRKILEIDQFYFFDNSYQPNRDHSWIEKRENVFEYIPQDFFYTKQDQKSSLEQVNVQAVVGKNGDGKSTLTELALRTFNNFFKAKEVHPVTLNLRFAKGLFAELYFLLNKQIYRIRVLEENERPLAFLETFAKNRRIVETNVVMEHLIFVMNVNYSHYALNSRDYGVETIKTRRKHLTTSWLDQIFHRNDGYQTPLTVHPFRTDGNIDVNNERDLTDQRLISLILNESSYKYINEDLKVDRFIFEKFEKRPLINALGRITENYEEEQSRSFDEADPKFLNLALIAQPNENAYFIQVLLEYIQTWRPPSRRDPNILDYLSYEEASEPLGGTSREQILIYISWLNEIGQAEIMQLALMCRGMRLLQPDVDLEEPLQRRLFEYLCVKSKKMLRYPQYSDIMKMIELRKYDIAINAYIKSLRAYDSHVAIKFNQSNQLLKLCQIHPDADLVKFYRNIVTQERKEIPEKLANISKYISEARGLMGEKIPEIYFNPPGIFKNKVMLIATGKDEPIELRSISSGQYQKLSMLSSIIYHLKNIDSVKDSGYGQTNQYDQVLLILDEIELYFHPDFQRTLLKELLAKISEVTFKQIKSINILFVTHSPFLLSDIPKNNVLFLENGLPSHPMTENTFGSNIHTLLQHGFFLKGVPIGEFAKDKINSLFYLLNQKGEIGATAELEKRILMVSEPFLRSQLLKLFHERSPNQQIYALEKEIQELKKLIHDRN